MKYSELTYEQGTAFVKEILAHTTVAEIAITLIIEFLSDNMTTDEARKYFVI